MDLLRYDEVFFEDVVGMYFDMTKEIYPHKRIGNKQNFYREVDSWTLNGSDLTLVISKGDVVGFSKSFVDYHHGLWEPDYHTELLYIKPDYRKTRALSVLANDIVRLAKSNGLDNSINARVDNGFAELIKKHYNTISSFIKLEKRN